MCGDTDGNANRDARRNAGRDADNDANNDASRRTDNDASQKKGRDANRDARRNAGRDANNDASNLDILYTNTQSLVNKIEEMRALMAINNPNITIITETWTNDLLNINGYDIIKQKD